VNLAGRLISGGLFLFPFSKSNRYGAHFADDESEKSADYFDRLMGYPAKGTYPAVPGSRDSDGNLQQSESAFVT